MSSTHKIPKKIEAILAIIFLLPALYIFIVWAKIFNDDISQPQKISLFTDHFHVAINNYKTILYISLAFCIIAMILAAKSFRQRLVSIRVAMWLTVIIASLIFFIDIFQLI